MAINPPKIYHITHIYNLEKILADGHLYADRVVKNGDNAFTDVGMSHIKQRRMEKVVPCHPDTTVGEYVPFYFCPRSVMLYILHRGNHPDITYKGGQSDIITLEFDFDAVVSWADREIVKWTFTDRNASTGYAQFYTTVLDLAKLNWQAIRCPDFRQSEIKDAKQAEFLVYQGIPVNLITRIGVCNDVICDRVKTIWSKSGYNLVDITTLKEWYY